MSSEESKAIVRRFIDAINERNLAILGDLIAQDFCYYAQSHQIQGLNVIRQVIENEVKGFPDFQFSIEDIIAEGDKVWVRLRESMTNTGEYRGLAPTGKKITTIAVHNFRIVNGKVVEDAWHVADELDFYKQLGVIEYTEKGKKLLKP